MIHAIRLVQQLNSQGLNYVKQLNLDDNRNILICRMKSSVVYCVQLLHNQESKSTIIESVDSYRDQKEDSISQFMWLSRMSCYTEGSKMGLLKIRDLERAGQCIM